MPRSTSSSCCDVLEHVRDLDRVIAETARVLRPGGLYLFDTINRTWRSRVLAIKAMQEWRLTRIMDTAIHEWSMFIPPEELGAILDRHGMDVVEVAGLAPRAGVPRSSPPCATPGAVGSATAS